MKPELVNIVAFIKENLSGDPSYEYGAEFWDDEIFKPYELEEVDDWGGEGEGDDIGRVVKLTNRETKAEDYIMFSGYYASHYGSDWDSSGVKVVEPIEVKKRDWKEVK